MEQHLADVVGHLNLSPVGSDTETPKVSHTNPGVDNSKCADLEKSKLEIGGVETAILIKSLSTLQKPNCSSVGFFYFKLIRILGIIHVLLWYEIG
jgi:hypothetical protein